MVDRDSMDDIRLQYGGAEVLLDGSPIALRRLARRLQNDDARIDVRFGDEARLLQLTTAGPLRVTMQDRDLVLEGSRDSLGIVWDALVSVAQEAEAGDPTSVGRHAHIEHLGPDDGYRAADSIPLVIGADWPT